VFGDGGYDFIFGIVIYRLQFVKGKCLQFWSDGAFNIKGGDKFWGRHPNYEELHIYGLLFLGFSGCVCVVADEKNAHNIIFYGIIFS
jgi:hypothetical protein